MTKKLFWSQSDYTTFPVTAFAKLAFGMLLAVSVWSYAQVALMYGGYISSAARYPSYQLQPIESYELAGHFCLFLGLVILSLGKISSPDQTRKETLKGIIFLLLGVLMLVIFLWRLFSFEG